MMGHFRAPPTCQSPPAFNARERIHLPDRTNLPTGLPDKEAAVYAIRETKFM